MKYIAVEGCTLSFRNPSHSGTITITSPASSKVKADNKGVYKSLLNVVISNGTDGSTTSSATGSGVIIATATKTKADNIFVLRIDDESAVITMTGTSMSPPPPTSTYTTTVYISDAGQSKVKAN